MPDEQTGVSSTPTPASTSVSAPVDASSLLEHASEADYHKWRVTGELPPVKAQEPTEEPTPAAPAPAPEIPADEPPAEPATPPAKTPKKPPRQRTPEDTEKRFSDLLTERARERDRADRAERELADLRRGAAPAPVKDATPAASSPAAGDDPKPDAKDAAKYPDGHYDPQFMEDLADWKARGAIRAERQKAQQAHRERLAADHDRRITDSWRERTAKASEKYPDFMDVARSPSVIVPDGVIDNWILESPLGAELLYHLQTTPGVVERIQALPVYQQARELARVEMTLEEPDVKTVSDAPAPGRTLGDRSAAPADAAQAALKAGNFEAYSREMNNREVAAKRDPATGRFR